MKNTHHGIDHESASCQPPSYLKLQLHAGDVLSGLDLREFLDVCVQVPGRDLGGAAGDGLLERVVNEDILVFRLDHVVPLSAHERHVTVDVHRLLVFDSLQHGVDDDEAAGPTHAGTVSHNRTNV